MEEGYYWVYLSIDYEWTVGEFSNGQWWFIGSEVPCEKLRDRDIIGDRIYPPCDKIQTIN